MPHIKTLDSNEIISTLMDRFGYKNVMQVPKLAKIVLNMGVGEAIQNIKILDSAVQELGLIAGQKPIISRARKSIAAFKLRAGMPIGCKVTLRGVQMSDFFTRLVNIALPRVRDFRGISPKGFDGRGNYSMGLQEQSVFPEIDPGRIDNVQGMNITFVTTAQTDDEGREMLRLLGMPYKEM